MAAIIIENRTQAYQRAIVLESHRNSAKNYTFSHTQNENKEHNSRAMLESYLPKSTGEFNLTKLPSNPPVCIDPHERAAVEHHSTF